MMQAFLLSVVYIFIGSLLLLMDFHRAELSFLLRFRAYLQDKKHALGSFFYAGLAIGVLLLLFPVDPGPMFIGDIIPALSVLILACYFRYAYAKSNQDMDRQFAGTKLSKRKQRLGYIFLIIAIVHFLLPSFVLL